MEAYMGSTSLEVFDDYTILNLGQCIRIDHYDINSINKKNSEGWTLLMYACHKGLSDLVRNLLAKGADVTCEDDTGRTPLMLAVSGANIQTVKDVFEWKKLEQTDLRGWTALFYAVFYGREDCAQFLVQQGANVHAKDKLGKTAMHLAKDYSMDKMVSILLGNETKENTKPALLAASTPNKRPSKMTEIFKSKRTFTPNMRSGDVSPNPKTPVGIKQSPRRALVMTPTPVWNSPRNQMQLPTSPSVANSRAVPTKPTVLEFLNKLDLTKYWPVFRDEEVDFDTFITLEEDNLKEIGINLYGPRRKISLAIKEYRQLHQIRII